MRGSAFSKVIWIEYHSSDLEILVSFSQSPIILILNALGPLWKIIHQLIHSSHQSCEIGSVITSFHWGKNVRGRAELKPRLSGSKCTFLTLTVMLAPGAQFQILALPLRLVDIRQHHSHQTREQVLPFLPPEHTPGLPTVPPWHLYIIVDNFSWVSFLHSLHSSPTPSPCHYENNLSISK